MRYVPPGDAEAPNVDTLTPNNSLASALKRGAEPSSSELSVTELRFGLEWRLLRNVETEDNGDLRFR